MSQTSKDLVSISEAARRMGVQRPTLSKIIHSSRLEIKKSGHQSLVSFSQCQEIVQNLFAQGKLRRKKTVKLHSVEDTLTRLCEDLRVERKDLQRDLIQAKKELADLHDKYSDLKEINVNLASEVKLLQGKSLKTSLINHLSGKVQKIWNVVKS